MLRIRQRELQVDGERERGGLWGGICALLCHAAFWVMHNNYYHHHLYCNPCYDHHHNNNNNNLDHNLKIDLLLKDNLLNNLSLNKHSDNLLHKKPSGGLSLNLKQGLKNLKRLLYREMVLKHQ